jgi:molybdate transport system ATP-binding protein
MSLRLQEIHLRIGAFSLEVDITFDRTIVGIFGPSGAGKTSLLEIIAGLRRPSAGIIKLDDTILFHGSAHVNLPARLRHVGYVPQDLALFPHLNVEENVRYGYRTPNEQNAELTLQHVVAVMEIASFLQRDVTSLSGGEQQRVAFARAILSAPRLLLLDEPMSSLDSRLKDRLVPFLLRIRDEFHIPLIYVTHDAGELVSLCDEVVLLENGRVNGRTPPQHLLPEQKR